MCRTIRSEANLPSCGCLFLWDFPRFCRVSHPVTHWNSTYICTTTMKTANWLSASLPFPATWWILTCGSSSPRRLYMAFSPVSPSMILASSSSPTAWCLSHCLSLPLAYNRTDALIHSLMCVRQFRSYQTWHMHEFSL